MNAAELNKYTRYGILGDLLTARPATLPPATLLMGRREAGLPLTETTLQNELSYLMDKGLVKSVRSSLSAGSVRYAITAAGIDELEAEGLA